MASLWFSSAIIWLIFLFDGFRQNTPQYSATPRCFICSSTRITLPRAGYTLLQECQHYFRDSITPNLEELKMLLHEPSVMSASAIVCLGKLRGVGILKISANTEM